MKQFTNEATQQMLADFDKSLSLTLIWPQWMWMLDKLLSRTLKGIANTR
jgi:hypothetical protein